MKAAHLWDRHDAPGRDWLRFAPVGAVVIEALVRTRPVVVREIGAEQAAEVPPVEDDNLVETFPSNRPDDPFDKGTLPRGSWGDDDLADTHAVDSALKVQAVEGIAITE